jgi:hypothetical protein
MKSASLVSEWSPIKYVAANKRTEPLELPAAKVHRKFILDVSFDIVVSGGSSDPAYVEDAPFTLLQEVEVTIGGKAYRRLSGVALRWLFFLAHGGKDPVYTKPTISGAGTYSFNFQLPLDCGTFEKDHLLPDKSNLFTPEKEKTIVKLLFGTSTDVMTGGDRTIAVPSNVDIRLILDEPQVPETPKILRTLIEEEVTWGSATTGLLKPIDIDSETQIRRITLIAYTSSVRSNAVLNRWDLLAGTKDTIVGNDFSRLQRMNENDRGFAIPTGVVEMDFDKSKRWADIFDARKLKDLRHKFDVDAPSSSKIKVLVDICKEI